jgi:hypothetical protein
MMSCQEAARLISEGKDHPLSMGQKLGLKMHLVFCALCRGYRKNLEMLSRIAERAGEAVMSRLAVGPADEGLVLSAASKQRMKNELSKFRPSD